MIYLTSVYVEQTCKELSGKKKIFSLLFLLENMYFFYVSFQSLYFFEGISSFDVVLCLVYPFANGHFFFKQHKQVHLAQQSPVVTTSTPLYSLLSFYSLPFIQRHFISSSFSGRFRAKIFLFALNPFLIFPYLFFQPPPSVLNIHPCFTWPRLLLIVGLLRFSLLSSIFASLK